MCGCKVCPYLMYLRCKQTELFCWIKTKIFLEEVLEMTISHYSRDACTCSNIPVSPPTTCTASCTWCQRASWDSTSVVYTRLLQCPHIRKSSRCSTINMWDCRDIGTCVGIPYAASTELHNN